MTNSVFVRMPGGYSDGRSSGKTAGQAPDNASISAGPLDNVSAIELPD